jgi:outer membrane immunogenic protein
MKKLLVAVIATTAFCGAPALAADMPVKAPPVAPIFNWSGCYVGGNGGYGWANKDWTFVPNIPVGSHTANGWTAGGQIGCDWQANPTWILGARVMYNWADLSGSNIETAFTGHTVNTQVRGFGTAVVRAGWQANPSWLFYGLGGLAWINDKHWEANRNTGLVEAISGTITRFGFDVGVGAEYLINPNWSFFVEYDYMRFGTRRVDFAFVANPGIEQFDIRQNMQKILVGLNWRWSGLVQARY